MDDYRRGEWAGYDRVLNYLNTLDEQCPDKKRIYAAIMEMRPLGDVKKSDQPHVKELDMVNHGGHFA